MESLLEKEKTIEERFRFALELAGNEGRFQKIIFCILLIASFISSLTITILPFHKEAPEYHCYDRQEFEDDKSNDLYKLNENYKLFYDDQCILKHCRYHPKFINERLTILVADYSKLGNFVTELNLFCEVDTYFLDFSQYLFVGRLLGLFIFSYISDKYGRYTSFKLMVFILLFCYLSYFFLKHKLIFLFIGMASNSCMFLWNLVCLMSTEMMSEKMYNLANCIITCAFSFTGITNIFFMYYFSNWNIILFVQIFTILILLYLSSKYMTETVGFLLWDKRYAELIKTIEFISSINNSEDNVKHQLVMSELERIKLVMNITYKLSDDKLIINEKIEFRIIEVIKLALGPYLLIFKSCANIWNIAKILFVYTTGTFIYYGQLFFIEEIPGSIYFNLLLVFTAEVIFELISGQLLMIMEKKDVLLLSNFFLTIGCFLIYMIENEIIKLAMLILVTMCNSINYVAMAVFLSDNFDISVKSTSTSLTSLISNLFMMFSARVIYVFGNSYLAFGVFSFFSTINLIFIKDRKLNASSGNIH